ncbi:MAG: hypothetical protein ACIAXF_07940 [Phycisphaerales bacterium JB063]
MVRNNTRRRLGEILTTQGTLTKPQLRFLLDAQRDDARPLGELARSLFGVPLRQIESAWRIQRLQGGDPLDLSRVSPNAKALELITPRQAWQFEMLPLFWNTRSLVVVASTARLGAASKFAWRTLPGPIELHAADPYVVRRWLGRCYRWQPETTGPEAPRLRLVD